MLSIWMRFSENLMEWKKYFHYCIQLISMFPLFLILMTKWYRWTLISIASVWKKKGISTRVKLKSQRNRTKLSRRETCAQILLRANAVWWKFVSDRWAGSCDPPQLVSFSFKRYIRSLKILELSSRQCLFNHKVSTAFHLSKVRTLNSYSLSLFQLMGFHKSNGLRFEERKEEKKNLFFLIFSVSKKWFQKSIFRFAFRGDRFFFCDARII